MVTQRIIVYRNPLEAAFWESDMLVPLVGGMGTGLVLFLIIMMIAGRVTRKVGGPSDVTITGAALTSIFVGFAVLNHLML